MIEVCKAKQGYVNRMTIFCTDALRAYDMQPFFTLFMPNITISTETWKGMPYLYGRYVPIDALPMLFDSLFYHQPATHGNFKLVGCRDVLNTAERAYGVTKSQAELNEMFADDKPLRYVYDTFNTRMMSCKVYGTIDQLLMHVFQPDGYLSSLAVEMTLSSSIDHIGDQITPEFYALIGISGGLSQFSDLLQDFEHL